MRFLSVLVVLVFATGFVYADNLFQNNNPFPQTSPQNMNNIYESSHSVMVEEAKTTKKPWWKKNRYTEPTVREYPSTNVIHEGVQNGSFYTFK